MKKITFAIGLWSWAVFGQTSVDLRTQSKSVDFSGAVSTKPFKTGTVLPASCQPAEAFLLISASAGQNVYFCLTPSVWQLQGGVTSVFGRSGAVAPQVGDYGFSDISGIAAINQGGTGAISASGALSNLGAAPVLHTHVLTDLSGITGKHGNSGELVTFGAGESPIGDCVKFDANGNVISAGAPCNTVSSPSANPSVSFTAQTSVTISHQLNTFNILFQCYDAVGNALEPGGFTIVDANEATVTFAAAATGRCVVNGTSGSGLGAAGGDLNGVYPNPTLAASGVAAGTYGGATVVPVITVDAKGRLTNVGTATVSGSASGSAGGDLTGTYPNPTLAASGVSAGTYGGPATVPVITVDAKGRLTTVSTATVAGPGGVAGGDLTGTYPNPVLAATGVAAGTYGSGAEIPVLTFDAKGRVLSASTVPAAGGGSGVDVLAAPGIVITGSNPKTIGIDPAIGRGFLTGGGSLTFTNMVAHTCQERTFPVVGALTGSGVAPHWPNSLNAGLIGTMFVNNSNEVTVRLCNVLTSSITPTSGLTFSATVLMVF